MKNYISININYLVKKLNFKQDEFGAMFDIGKNVTGSYILGKALPKLETIDKICAYFEITIDQFVKQDLSKGYKTASSGGEDENTKRLRAGIVKIEQLEELLQVTKENASNQKKYIAILEQQNKELKILLSLCQDEKKTNTAVVK